MTMRGDPPSRNPIMTVRRILPLVLLALCPLRADVRVWQGTLPLPTYEEGLPDVNPPFDQFANQRFNYPYTLRDNLTGRAVVQNWRALFVENEYRSEEHTSELQSPCNLVCRLLLEKKKDSSAPRALLATPTCFSITEHTQCRC